MVVKHYGIVVEVLIVIKHHGLFVGFRGVANTMALLQSLKLVVKKRSGPLTIIYSRTFYNFFYVM